MVFLAIVMVAGTISSMIPTTTFAQSYEDSYVKDKKTSNLNKQNVNCNNIIINGVNSAGQGSGGDMINPMTTDGEGDGTGQWIENGDKKDSNGIDKNIVNFCKNKHNKIVVEPQTGSLTVKKEIFGCVDENPDDQFMECQGFGPDDDQWISCDNSAISNTPFCLNLQESFFDIEVLDDTETTIQQFEGSQQGTTIPNLPPGMYSVKEITEDGSGVLNPPTQVSLEDCNTGGFPESGRAVIGIVSYANICIAYEDEQGNDCSTTTIATGEDKTCIVKNYIRLAGIGL